MTTTLTPINNLMGIWKVAMEIIENEIENLKSAWKKTSEQQLFNELETEYGFPRATCRSLVQLMHEFIEQNYGNQREDKQIIYQAVGKDEPPGKQLDKIKIVSVKITITHPEDASILETKDVGGLRQHKLVRFTNEAYDQGGLLVQEDFALLVNSSVRTIQRDMKELRDRGIDIPTRGSIQDIGPTISHKTKIVELWLKGFEYTEIELRTNHSGHAIKRYLVDFSRIVMLQDKGYTSNQIRELTNNSEKVVKEHLDLFDKYKDEGKDRIQQLLKPSKMAFETSNKKKEMNL